MRVIAYKVLETVYPVCEENSVCKQATKHVLHTKSMWVGNYDFTTHLIWSIIVFCYDLNAL